MSLRGLENAWRKRRAGWCRGARGARIQGRAATDAVSEASRNRRDGASPFLAQMPTPVIGELRPSRIAECPDGVMRQESAFPGALEMVAVARVEGNRLELRSSEGALAVTAVRKSADPPSKTPKQAARAPVAGAKAATELIRSAAR